MSYDRDDLGYDLGYDLESLHIGNNSAQKIFKSKENEVQYWMNGPPPAPSPSEAPATLPATPPPEAPKKGSFSISGDSVVFKSADGKNSKTVKTNDIPGLGSASTEFTVDLPSVTKAITKARKEEEAAAAAGRSKGDNFKPGEKPPAHLIGANKEPKDLPPPPAPENA